jgi:predicted GIY-YIG superfamily endonuclease
VLVYLLHFEKPLKHAQHYIGSTTDHGLARRMGEHATGQGAKLTAAVARARIPMTLARLWYSPDRRLETKLKAGRNARALCPVCRFGEIGNPVLTGVPYAPAIGSWKPAHWTGD